MSNDLQAFLEVARRRLQRAYHLAAAEVFDLVKDEVEDLLDEALAVPAFDEGGRWHAFTEALFTLQSELAEDEEVTPAIVSVHLAMLDDIEARERAGGAP